MTYTVGIIGTGAKQGGEGLGMAMGYRHADAYSRLDECELVAGADIVQEHADRFARHFELGGANAYEDHRAMLSEHDFDIVSVTTPIPTHADIVLDAMAIGDADAVHCEKPMAYSWDECTLLAQEAWRRDVQLTFNHQLRLAEPVQEATAIIENGGIGEVTRVEMGRDDFFESGIHQVDLCSHFVGDVSAEWAMGQVEYREENKRNGVHLTDQTMGMWEYGNGVHAIAATGSGSDAIGPLNRVIGTDGVVEFDFDETRIRRAGGDWEPIGGEVDDPLPDAIEHVVECVGTDEKPLLGARNALNSTEIIFGVWESVRQRGRVDFPLTIDDNPLVAMIESGEFL